MKEFEEYSPKPLPLGKEPLRNPRPAEVLRGGEEGKGENRRVEGGGRSRGLILR